MANTDEGEIGTAELVNLDRTNGSVSFELLYDFVDPSTLPCQIAQTGSSRHLTVIDETRGTIVYEYSDIPSVSGEYTINKSFLYDRDAELRFELEQLHVCTSQDPFEMFTETWYLDVTGTVGNPSGPEFLASDYDSDTASELVLWDAVKNDSGDVGWVDIEVTGDLAGEGHYQIQEGTVKEDVVRDVTGVTTPDRREVSFPSSWSKVIVWYIHPDLEDDLIVEAEYRDRDSGEQFPGDENQSTVEVTTVNAESTAEQQVTVNFTLENVIESGSGSTVDYNANVEVDSWTEENVEGSLSPGQVTNQEVILTGVDVGDREICVWV
jgi:hypothetical protein